jgi:hypothetical protein
MFNVFSTHTLIQSIEIVEIILRMDMLYTYMKMSQNPLQLLYTN